MPRSLRLALLGGDGVRCECDRRDAQVAVPSICLLRYEGTRRKREVLQRALGLVASKECRSLRIIRGVAVDSHVAGQ